MEQQTSRANSILAPSLTEPAPGQRHARFPPEQHADPAMTGRLSWSATSAASCACPRDHFRQLHQDFNPCDSLHGCRNQPNAAEEGTVWVFSLSVQIIPPFVKIRASA